MEKCNGIWILKWQYPYYMHTQVHLAVPESNYCDFIVFTCNEMVIKCILPDMPFFEANLLKVQKFMKVGILPEVIGKWFSRIPIGGVASNSENVSNNMIPQIHSALVQIDTSSDDEDPQNGVIAIINRIIKIIICHKCSCSIRWFHFSLKLDPKFIIKGIVLPCWDIGLLKHNKQWRFW